MAGIGFELKNLLDKQTFFSYVKAYSAAGLLSSGPWLLSIFAIILASSFSLLNIDSLMQVRHFQVMVVYLISSSLILSSIFQYSFSRYVADSLFLNRIQEIIPNFNSIALVLLAASSVLVFLFFEFFFPSASYLLRSLFAASFSILCIIWVGTGVLTGTKAYKTIFYAFALGYGLMVLLIYGFNLHETNLLLMSFLIGQCFLLVCILYVIYTTFPAKSLMNFDFLATLDKKNYLVFSGFFYNLGLWIDKYIFWYHANTGQAIFGPFHASTIYDLPIFWSYLSIIPAMASFLLSMETNFSDKYQVYYENICDGGTLKDIKFSRNNLVIAAREATMSLIKTQAIVVVTLLLLMIFILQALKISPLYFNLLGVLLLAASLNVIFWGLLNFLDYLDQKKTVFFLTFLFFLTNLVFTLISIKLGVFYYGYGVGLSLLLVVLMAFYFLKKQFFDLTYKTFMLSDVGE